MTADILQAKNLVPTLPLALKKLLCALAGYFDGNLHRFKMDADGNLALVQVSRDQNAIKLPLIIVARHYYNEQARDYPLENKAELKKLLVLESSEPANSYSHIWGHNNGHSQVNTWQFNEQVPAALIRLPETLLLAMTAENNQVVETAGAAKIYLARTNNLIHSLPQTAVINSSQRFAISVGLAQTEQVKSLEPGHLASALALGLKKLPPAVAGTFIKIPKPENRLQLLKNITLPFFIVLGAYLAASSGYLAYKQNSLEQQLANQGDEVSVALEQQQTFDDQFSRHLALTDFLAPQNTTAQLWLVMAELFPQAKFTNIRLVGQRFVLRGQTSAATKLLELISKNSLVIDAKFDFPTRKNRGQEVFVISFELGEVKPLAVDSEITHANDNTGLAEANKPEVKDNGGA